eukprot:415895_1
MKKQLWMIALLVAQTLLTFSFASYGADYSLSTKNKQNVNALKLASAYVRGNYVIDERFCFPDHICSTIADYVAETGLLTLNLGLYDEFRTDWFKLTDVHGDVNVKILE